MSFRLDPLRNRIVCLNDPDGPSLRMKPICLTVDDAIGLPVDRLGAPRVGGPILDVDVERVVQRLAIGEVRVRRHREQLIGPGHPKRHDPAHPGLALDGHRQRARLVTRLRDGFRSVGLRHRRRNEQRPTENDGGEQVGIGQLQLAAGISAA